MSQIQVTDLTYGYEGSFDTVFENVSFGIDTDWKLGLIGRNGKGKTTFLNLRGEKGFILISHDRDILDACIDHVLVLNRKTIEVQSRVTQYERRMEREIQEKEGLLQDVEQPVSLKLMPLSYHKELLISCRELSVRYEGAESDTLKNLTFELMHGERVFLHGENGCGKSTLIKTILQKSGSRYEKLFVTDGEIRTASNLVVSYINQDTSFLQGKKFRRKFIFYIIAPA